MPTRIITMLMLLCLVTLNAQAQTKEALPKDLVVEVKKAVDRGLKFLRSKQESDGSYSHHVGVTGTALLAFGESHRNYKYDEGPFIGLAADWLLTQVKPNGSISGANTPTTIQPSHYGIECGRSQAIRKTDSRRTVLSGGISDR